MTTISPAEAPTGTTGTPRMSGSGSTDSPLVVLKRRTVDTVLISLGAVIAVAVLVAGALLMWGANFAADYVDKELSSQNISFPPAATLEEESAERDALGLPDITGFADQAVNTGGEAEAYASLIDGHLHGIADGATYADLGGPEREANAAVTAATESGASDSEIAALEDDAAAITGQRNTLFKGETLRGLLLTAYAWSTVGRIAGYAAIAAFLAGAVMVVLVALGIRHHHKVAETA